MHSTWSDTGKYRAQDSLFPWEKSLPETPCIHQSKGLFGVYTYPILLGCAGVQQQSLCRPPLVLASPAEHLWASQNTLPFW